MQRARAIKILSLERINLVATSPPRKRLETNERKKSPFSRRKSSTGTNQ